MLDVCLLGTGGMMPLPNRWLTSLLMRYNGKMLLIDCGEGTQIPLKMAGWGFKAIEAIFFTHYHADHISGLPGLLLTIGNSGKDTPLNLIGPPGLRLIVKSLLAICPSLPYDIRLYELPASQKAGAGTGVGAEATVGAGAAVGAEATVGAGAAVGAEASANADSGANADASAGANADWGADSDAGRLAESAASSGATGSPGGAAGLGGIAYSGAGPGAADTGPGATISGAGGPAPLSDMRLFGNMSFRYLPVNHNMPCLAYSFFIKRPGEFHPDRARALGVPIPLWKTLQSGESVALDDGRLIEPGMVLGEGRKGIKLSYCTDSRPTARMAQLFRDSDLLVCEGLYGDDAELENAAGKKHMVFSEAARLAKSSGAAELWLTHYSPAMQNPFDYAHVARAIFPNTKPGKDLMFTTLAFG